MSSVIHQKVGYWSFVATAALNHRKSNIRRRTAPYNQTVVSTCRAFCTGLLAIAITEVLNAFWKKPRVFFFDCFYEKNYSIKNAVPWGQDHVRKQQYLLTILPSSTKWKNDMHLLAKKKRQFRENIRWEAHKYVRTIDERLLSTEIIQYVCSNKKNNSENLQQ